MLSTSVFEDPGGRHSEPTSMELAFSSSSRCKSLTLVKLYRLADGILTPDLQLSLRRSLATKQSVLREKYGAGDGIRTHDFLLGKQTLYR